MLAVGTVFTAWRLEVRLQRAGTRLLEAVERRLFSGAVYTISPLVEYLLSDAADTAAAQAEINERMVMAELEQLMLEEQGVWGGTGAVNGADPGEAVGAANGTVGADGGAMIPGGMETEGGAAADGSGQAVRIYYFPEDSEELPQNATEFDADLLAEIDRENEALRQQAILAQNGGAAADGDTGQDTAQDAGASPETAGTEAGEDSAQVATSFVQNITLPYSMEQLGSQEFLLKNCYYLDKTAAIDDGLLDAAAMLAQDMRLERPDEDGPKVLIHHTHATEYFADSDPNDPSTLIVGVGDYLEELLENQYGIEVIHDTTVYPYNEAYSRALKNVEQILAENPTIEVFIDLHRNSAGSRKYTEQVDGKEMANLMFFNGVSQNVNGPIDYLTNDNLSQNLAFSFQLKMAGDSFYPGLCKRNYLKSYRYNLHVLPRSVIVEVGDNNNTLEEAKNAMEALARILNFILNGE